MENNLPSKYRLAKTESSLLQMLLSKTSYRIKARFHMALMTLNHCPRWPLPTSAPTTFLCYIHLQSGPKTCGFTPPTPLPHLSAFESYPVHQETTSDLTSSKSSLLRSSALLWTEFQVVEDRSCVFLVFLLSICS